MRQVAFKPATSARKVGAPCKVASSRSRGNVVTCSLVRDETLGRRQLLSAAGTAVLAAAAAPLLVPSPALAGPLPQTLVPVEQLGLLQKQAQLKDFRLRAQAAIKEVVGAADAQACMRLVLNDASTYDAETKTGGMDGSIVLPEELGRPENAGLDAVVAKLAEAKAKIDAAGVEDGSGPISWADLLVLAAKVTTQAQWASIKVSRAAIASGGDVIAGPAFGAAWPVRLGRVDATSPGAPGRIPLATAPVAEIKAYMSTLGVKPGSGSSGLFSAKPPFWERPTLVLWTAAAADPAAEEERFVAEDASTFKGYKVNYDRSRKTVTRTDYEVDFIDYFTMLTNLGATFKKDAYLHPEAVVAVRF